MVVEECRQPGYLAQKKSGGFRFLCGRAVATDVGGAVA